MHALQKTTPHKNACVTKNTTVDKKVRLTKKYAFLNTKT